MKQLTYKLNEQIINSFFTLPIYLFYTNLVCKNNDLATFSPNNASKFLIKVKYFNFSIFKIETIKNALKYPLNLIRLFSFNELINFYSIYNQNKLNTIKIIGIFYYNYLLLSNFLNINIFNDKLIYQKLKNNFFKIFKFWVFFIKKKL